MERLNKVKICIRACIKISESGLRPASRINSRPDNRTAIRILQRFPETPYIHHLANADTQNSRQKRLLNQEQFWRPKDPKLF